MDSPGRWQQVEALYNAARERGPAALLGAPDDLRREVESLLSQESNASNILNKGDPLNSTQALTAVRPVGPGSVTPGMALGPYRIEAPIGQGGMPRHRHAKPEPSSAPLPT